MTMQSNQLPPWADRLSGDALAAIALEAGNLIMKIRADGYAIRRKTDDSLVTLADHKAEELILERLHALAPQLPVLAEEEVDAGRIPELGEFFACVDPLDGTREFVAGRDDFTVNIALIHHQKPIAGVIYAPAHGSIHVARQDMSTGQWQGWWSRIAGGREGKASFTDIAQRSPLSARMLPVSPIAIVSRSHRSKKATQFLEDYDVLETISAGSSLKFCLIARGEADLYPRFSRTMEWDIAAGHALVEAAGGSVTTMEGEPLLYGKKARGYDNPAFLARGVN